MTSCETWAKLRSQIISKVSQTEPKPSGRCHNRKAGSMLAISALTNCVSMVGEFSQSEKWITCLFVGSEGTPCINGRQRVVRQMYPFQSLASLSEVQVERYDHCLAGGFEGKI